MNKLILIPSNPLPNTYYVKYNPTKTHFMLCYHNKHGNEIIYKISSDIKIINKIIHELNSCMWDYYLWTIRYPQKKEYKYI